MSELPTGSERLRAYLNEFLAGEMDAATFSRSVEIGYNAAVDEDELPASEQPIWEKLFYAAAFFSPFEEERAELPHHLLGEEQVRLAAVTAQAELHVPR